MTGEKYNTDWFKGFWKWRKSEQFESIAHLIRKREKQRTDKQGVK